MKGRTYRLISDRDAVSDVERWAIGHMVLARILVTAAIGMVLSRYVLGRWIDAGVAETPAYVLTFLVMNVAFFAACARYWLRREVPFGPRRWRTGRSARIMVGVAIVKASLWALLPLDVQLMVALTMAAVALNG